MFPIHLLAKLYILRCQRFDLVFRAYTVARSWSEYIGWTQNCRFCMRDFFSWTHVAGFYKMFPRFFLTALKGQTLRDNKSVFSDPEANVLDGIIVLLHYLKGTNLQSKSYFCHKIIWAPLKLFLAWDSVRMPSSSLVFVVCLVCFFSMQRILFSAFCFCFCEAAQFYFEGKLLIPRWLLSLFILLWRTSPDPRAFFSPWLTVCSVVHT